MRIVSTDLEGVLLIEPDVFTDERGFFMESWNAQRYRAHGMAVDFVQDNISYSRKNVLRGLHYQNPSPQGKLVSVWEGKIFDVAVDLRLGSPTFGAWTSAFLSSEDKRQFFIPEGFAHGFVVLSNSALVNYKCTCFYDKQADSGIRWDDPDIGIAWPVKVPVLSEKDARAPRLRNVPAHALYSRL